MLRRRTSLSLVALGALFLALLVLFTGRDRTPAQGPAHDRTSVEGTPPPRDTVHPGRPPEDPVMIRERMVRGRKITTNPMDRVAGGIQATPAGGPAPFVLRDRHESAFFARGFVAISMIGTERGRDGKRQGAGIHWAPVGAAAVDPRAEGELPGKLSRMVGDAKTWAMDQPMYSTIAYDGIKPGIDLAVDSQPHGIHYTLQAAAGADLANLAFRYGGADAVQVAEDGKSVRVLTAVGEINETGLHVYQGEGSNRQEIPSHYVQMGPQEYAIALGDYDRNRPVTIDPTMTWSTFLGSNLTSGSDYETSRGLAVDGSGNVYVVGSTSSADFPTTGGVLFTSSQGSDDAYVVKINSTGTSVAWSTLLGGSGYDYAYAVAVDSGGNVYVAGQTDSTNFPTSVTAYKKTLSGGEDTFVTKLNNLGTAVVWSTLLGGNSSESPWALAVDGSGNAYVGGYTYSSDFPTTGGLGFAFNASGNADGFVTKINSTGTGLVWSSLIGGSNYDYVYALCLDSSSNVYVTGYTSSSNFPKQSPFQPLMNGSDDAFVCKIQSTGTAFAWSSFLGGNSDDAGYGIAIDSSNNVYVTGYTYSTTFPGTASSFRASNAGNADAFVTKVNSSGASVAWSSYLGGSGQDYGYNVGVDSGGNVYVSGQTGSSTFPAPSGSQSTIVPYDFFVAKLASTGMTAGFVKIIGGNSSEYFGQGVTDSAGNTYITGTTYSTTYPTTVGMIAPLHSAIAGSVDVVVTKLNNAGTTVWSTMFGGSSGKSYNDGRAIALDSSGNIFVTGQTDGSTFPTPGGFSTTYHGNYDSYVTKYNAAGTAVQWSTYLGGNDEEDPTSIAVGPGDFVYAAGYTYSEDFPHSGPGLNLNNVGFGTTDGYVVKFPNAGGAPMWSRFVGGTSYDYINGVAVDPSGNVCVTGYSDSTDLPTLGSVPPVYLLVNQGSTDSFVSKLSSVDGSKVWITYLGGSNYDYAYSIKVDGSGNTYVAGYTGSTNFPTLGSGGPAYQTGNAGNYDLFVTKLNSTGSALVWSTMVGGTSTDYLSDLDIDASGNAYVVGYTYSTDYPTTALAFNRSAVTTPLPFLTEVNSTGTNLVCSTFLGGTSSTYPNCVRVDAFGNAFVSGTTYSNDLLMKNAFNSTYNQNGDGFVMKFNATNGASQQTLAWSSYIGGSQWENLQGLALKSDGTVMFVGSTSSTNFPLNGALDSTMSNQKATVGRISNNVPNVPALPLQHRTSNDVGLAVGDWTNEGTVTVKATLSDPEEDQVFLRVEMKPIGSAFDFTTNITNGTLVASGSRPSVVVTFPAGTQFHWQVQTVDCYGHTSAWVSFPAGGNPETDRDVGYDAPAPAPTVVISNPSNATTYYTKNSPISVNGSSSDTLSGIAAVNWTRQGGVNGAATGTLSWGIGSIALVPGSNTITVTATDLAGNNGSSVLTAVYDTNAPSLALTSVTPGTAFTVPPSAFNYLNKSGSVVISGTVSDAAPGVLQSVGWVNSGGGSGGATIVAGVWSATVALAPGSNTIQVTATDAATNTSTVSTIVFYDNILPALTITSPTPPSAVTGSGSIVVQGTTSDANGVSSLTYSNPSVPTSGPITVGASWTSPSISLAVGSNLITFTATDGAGNTNQATLSVYRDNTAPTVGITTPTNTGAYTTGSGTVDLGGTAADDLSVASVTWHNITTGSAVTPATLSGPANSKSWSALGIPLAAGSNTIQVVATDSVGLTSTTATIVVDYVTTAPALAVTIPATATFVTSSATTPIHGTASGGGGNPLTGLTITNTANNTTPIVTASPPLSTLSTTFDATVNLVIGTNTVNVVADNTILQTTVTLTIICDPFVPAVTITTPSGTHSYVTSLGTLALSGVASDNRGVTQVDWTNGATGGSGTATLVGPATSLTWSVASIPLSAIALNNIVVTAKDQAGNTTTDFINVTFDGTVPGVQITNPTSASTFTTTAASIGIGGTASDNNSVSIVTWSNAATGATGTATGTTSWSAAGVALAAGANSITVISHDVAANTASATITIFRDTGLPTATLSSPTGVGTYSTSSANIAIGGIASDDVLVSLVTWQNVSPLTTTSGSAVGTTAWSVASIPLDPGVNTITVRAKDGANQLSTINAASTLLVTYDPSVPTITITTPASSPFNTTSTPATVLGTSGDNVNVTSVKWTNVTTGGTGTASGTTAWSALVPLTSGLNVVQATAFDGAGNSTSASTNIVYDPAAPVVQITSPTSGTSFTTGVSPLSLAGIASDDVTVASVTWVNGAANGTATGTVSWLDSVPLTPGSNVITVTATDEVNRTGSTSLTVIYDPTAPTVTITSPTAAATFLTTVSPISISGVATDNLSVQNVTWTNAGNSTNGSATGQGLWSITSLALAPGSNLITIQATDAVGNIGSAAITVIYDATAPTLAVTALGTTPDPFTDPYATSTRPLPIAGTVSDNLHVASVVWANSLGGGGNANLTGTQPGPLTWDASVGLLAGSNVITVTAEDDHGNTTTVVFTINFTPESVAPTIQITGPGIGTVVSVTQVVDLSGVSDDNVGVVNITWKNVTTGARGVATFTPGMIAPWTASVPLRNGSNVIQVYAYDDAGNVTTDTITVTFVSPPDAVAPTVAIVTPPSGLGVYDASVAPLLMTISASDNVGIATVTWANPATGGGASAYFQTGSVWTASIALAVGANTVTVTATDASGNTATDFLIVNFVPTPGDTINPVVTITSHPTATSTTVSTPILNIAGTAGDNVSVAEVIWFDAATLTSGDADGTNSWTGQLTLLPGVNVITLRAYDTSGNTSTAQMTVIYTPPVYVPPPVHIKAGACGLLGLEILLPLALAAALRRRRERRRA